jgi:hypothetical protein
MAAKPEAAAAIAVGRRAGENIAGERTVGQGRARAAWVVLRSSPRVRRGLEPLSGEAGRETVREQ